jgi:exonuclease III
VEFVENENPDIFCIQETKAQKEQVIEFFEKEKTDEFESQSINIKAGKLFPEFPYHF